MASKASKNALNQEMSWLDAMGQPYTEQSYNQFQGQNQGTYGNIAGLYSPQSIAAANSGFDQGLNTYDQRVNDMYANPGYNASEISGMKQATEGGFAAPINDANNQMQLQQQRTGNSAGVNSNIGKLARQKGQLISAGLGGLQKTIGDARIQGQQSALAASQFPQQARLQRMQTEQATAGLGLSSAGQQQQAYGTGLSGVMGNANTRNANIAANPSFGQTFSQGLAGGLGKAIGSFGSTAKISGFNT